MSASLAGNSGQLRAGAVLTYGIVALQLLAALAYTPVMLRLLGQSEYGLYSLVVSIVGYLSLLSLGFGGAYVRFYARALVTDDQEGLRRLNGMFLLVFCLFGTVAGAVGAFLAFNAGLLLGDEFTEAELVTARILLAVLTVNTSITMPVSVFGSYIIAQERFIVQKCIEIVRVVATPLLSLLVLILGHRSVGMALATTSVTLFLGIYTIVYSCSRLGMRFLFRGMKVALFSEVAVFSGYLFMNMVVEQVNWNVDRFLVGRFHGAGPVAVYGVALMIASQYLVFASAISSVFTPRVHSMVAAGRPDEELGVLFIRVGRLTLLVLGLVLSGFTVFGRPFLAIWAGPGYDEAFPIVLLLLYPVTIPLLQNLGIEIQKARNLHQFRSWVYLLAAVVNVLVSIPVVREFGGVGTAAITGLSFVIGHGIIMNWHYHARLGLDMNAFWREMAHVVRGMVPALVVGGVVLCSGWVTSVWSLLLGIVCYILVYGCSVWWFSMNDYERGLIHSIRNEGLRAGRT